MIVASFHNNEILSDRLYVEPLKEGEIVVFKTLQAERMEKAVLDRSTGQMMDASSGEVLAIGNKVLSGKKMIYDPGDGKKKLIQNITGFTTKRDKDDNLVEEPVTDPIRFEKGYCVVTAENNETYIFMSRMDENGSNEHRDTSKPIVFFLDDPRKELVKQSASVEMKGEAIFVVRQADANELNAIAKAIDPSLLDNNIADLKRVLLKYADENPLLIIHNCNNKELQAKMHIEEAMKFQLLKYDKETRTYSWNTGKYEDIATAEVNQEPVDALVEAFSSREKNHHYRQLKKELDKIYKI